MSPELTSRVTEIPEYIEKLVGRGERKQAYLKICEGVKALPSGKGLHYKLQEFEELFGSFSKNKLNSIRSAMKTCGIKFPRVVFDDGIIYIWENKIGDDTRAIG